MGLGRLSFAGHPFTEVAEVPDRISDLGLSPVPRVEEELVPARTNAVWAFY